MDDQGFLFNSFVYLAAAVLIVPFAKRGGLGSVLGYLIAGVAIGPFALGLIAEPGDILHFSEFGVVMMLFLIGLELEPRLLWRLRRSILGLGGLQVLATTGLIAAIAFATGQAWETALAVGMALALSSTAIAMQTLDERHLTSTPAGRSAFSTLLFQDLAVIPMLAILPLLAISGLEHGAESSHLEEGFFVSLPGWAQALGTLGAVAAIVVAGRYLVRPVMDFIAATRIREIFTAFALFLIVGIALAMQSIGLSPALGTFLAGVVLAESEYRHQLETDIEPFKGLLLGLFFISVGMSINFSILAEQPGLIIALVAILVTVKLVVLMGLGQIFRMTMSQSLLYSFVLAQGGEFAFLLLQFATIEGAMTGELAALLVVVVALSMALTPLLMIVNERLIEPRFIRLSAPRDADTIEDEGNPVIVAGYGRFGQVVARMLHAQGIGTTVLDHDPDQIELIRKYGYKVYYGDAARIDLLRTAGAERAKLFILAIDDEEVAVESTKTVKQHFPQLKVLARARNRPHAHALVKAGADVYQRETFASAVELGRTALRELGFGAYRAHKVARTFAKHDIRTLVESFDFYDDEKRLISFAHAMQDDLDQVMQADDRYIDPPERDEAWESQYDDDQTIKGVADG